MKLPLGKLPREILEEKILKKIRVDSTVILPPKYGEDASIVQISDNLVISAADPITGATRYLGWLSVHVNANDIAVHAANPKWYLTILLFPKNTTQDKITETINGILEGLEEIDANLIGGHTEISDRVDEAIIAGFMMGQPMVKGRYITSSNAKPGDAILMTKGAGIEGTLIIASDLCDKGKCDKDLVYRALDYRKMISVLPEVKILVRELGIDNIHAMHDATEGGVINAVYELSKASGVGFKIIRENVIVRDETKRLAEIFEIDPLKLISSGTLIAAVPKDKAEFAVKTLRENGIDSAIIGEFTETGIGEIYYGDKKIDEVNKDIVDELWRLLEGK